MNYGRLALAALVAWVVDSIYGYVVFGLAMSGEFAKYPGVFRSFESVSGMLPLMFGASFVGMLAVAYVFAKGHEGGPGFQEGLRFGVVFALFGLFALSIPNYVIYNYGRRLAALGAVAAFVEMLLEGVILGLVYRPASTAARQARAVGV
jgi:hypothetical protein